MSEVKKTMVALVHGDETKQFDLQHAERILKYQKAKKISTGWQLKPDSGFELKEDGTINPTASGTAKNAKGNSGDTGSTKP
jgi:hypothetical protein